MSEAMIPFGGCEVWINDCVVVNLVVADTVGKSAQGDMVVLIYREDVVGQHVLKLGSPFRIRLTCVRISQQDPLGSLNTLSVAKDQIIDLRVSFAREIGFRSA